MSSLILAYETLLRFFKGTVEVCSGKIDFALDVIYDW